MPNIIHVTDETFALAVEAHAGPAIVDFWAAWCGPCRALAPVIERIAARYDGRVKVAKLDVDANPSTPSHFHVQSIPSVLFFLDGQLVDRTVGALPESMLATKIEQLLAAPALPR
jgi:thioredoxin 1